MGKRESAMENMVREVTSDFYYGKRILVTGHTGFKGTWLCRMLIDFGAEVTGYSLSFPTAEGEKIFRSVVKEDVASIEGDIRDLSSLEKAFHIARPEIVLHLAAQPIVLDSYLRPVETYEVNVMGTVNLMECVRRSDTVQSVVNVTTDKVYENHEWVWGYRETDLLNGYDPYANSKSCSELVTHCYEKSFFAERGIAVSTMRAGNVIGGGDFSPHRILPDCVRAAMAGASVEVRNPRAIRPYQHVLDPLYAYLMVAQAQYTDSAFSDCYNVGPNETDTVTTGELAGLFCTAWGEGMCWHSGNMSGLHESQVLRLDCSKLKSVFGWKPRWQIEEAVKRTVEWSKVYRNGEDIRENMSSQIRSFMGGKNGQQAGTA